MDYGNNQYGGGPPVPPSKGSAVASLVLGIISLALGWVIPFAGPIMSIVGLVLAVKGQRMGQGGMATAGLVLNIIALVFGAGITLCTCVAGCAACGSINTYNFSNFF